MNDVLDAVAPYLQRAKRSGNDELAACCPFHRKADGSMERDPSWSINLASGLWYCQSCHAAGNLYTFFRDVGLSRADIEFRYKNLIEEASRRGPLKPDPLNPIQATEMPLEETILGLFDYCPQALLDEGYPEDLLRRFDIGYDAMHRRITFPLRDHRGTLVGISGRAVDGRTPRYKVYDYEYRDFGMPVRKTEKRVLIWNFYRVAPQLLFEKDPGNRFIVITEGFKSVMRVAQAGISTVVGLLGSHLSEEQVALLSKLGSPAPTYLLMLDNNAAGRRGQFFAVQRLMKVVPAVQVVEYAAGQPSDLQPHEIIPALLQSRPAGLWLAEQQQY